MQSLEVSGAVRLIYRSLGVKGLIISYHPRLHTRDSAYLPSSLSHYKCTFVSYLIDMFPASFVYFYFGSLATDICGPGSSVGIVTGCGLDGPVIESRWRGDFPHLSRVAVGPTQPPVQWVPGLSRGKERPGRGADPPPHLVSRSYKE